jgi:hypothetical protein
VGWRVVVGLAVIVVVVLDRRDGRQLESPTTGYDASYPQCSGSYPPNPLFGIVGVTTAGLANNANRCLSGELHWASDTPGRSAEAPPCRCASTPLTPAGTTFRLAERRCHTALRCL